MQQLKEEVCLLIGAITGSSRVSFVRINHEISKVEILASSLGLPRAYDMRFAFTPISPERPSILLPSFKKFPYIIGHPIFDIIPNLHSLAAYLVHDKPQRRTMLIAWNPAAGFFKNDDSITIVERLINVSKEIFSEDHPSKEYLSAMIQKDVSTEGFAETTIVLNSEPLSKFLFETLISRKRLLARNGASYLALRQWRKSIKPYQLKALQALKSDEAPSSIETIASELVRQIETVYGKLFNAVVPIPGGSSGRKKSFSVLIAERVAKGLKIPCRDILISTSVAKGSSHPKKSIGLRPYKLSEPLNGNVLIVDDVASSGKHIELATNAIKESANYCTAVVWIAD